MNHISSASRDVHTLVVEAIGRLVADGTFPAEPLPDFIVEIPADRSHGDFASNVAMVCAKPLRMPPSKIAEAIAGAVILDGSPFRKVEIAGPGFMNFYLASGWYEDVLKNVLDEGADYGKTASGNGKRVLVEFVSANPTGPMHVGNARGGAIGDCLSSVLETAGYAVEREFYINDAGNQIEKFATSLEVRYLQKCGEPIEMPEDAYQGADIVAHAEAFFAEHGDKYRDAEKQARRDALVAFALPKNIQGLKDDLGQYRIQYDTWFPESTLHADGSVQRIIEQLKESGYTYENDGALWFKAQELGADKDFVIVRSNGIPTYVVPDIAYHYNKLVTRGFDRAIDILVADHHGYVPRLKAALTALGVDASRLTVVLMQMVAVMRDGKPVKQSKRSGKALTLITSSKIFRSMLPDSSSICVRQTPILNLTSISRSSSLPRILCTMSSTHTPESAASSATSPMPVFRRPMRPRQTSVSSIPFRNVNLPASLQCSPKKLISPHVSSTPLPSPSIPLSSQHSSINSTTPARFVMQNPMLCAMHVSFSVPPQDRCLAMFLLSSKSRRPRKCNLFVTF